MSMQLFALASLAQATRDGQAAFWFIWFAVFAVAIWLLTRYGARIPRGRRPGAAGA